VIDNLVTCITEVVLQELAEFESSVVGGDVNAHASILGAVAPG
jgi:hypothetical protein